MKITIISSLGHWKNGWVSHQSDLDVLVAALERSDIQVEHVEVSSLKMLQDTLSQLKKTDLIWPNAYYVDKEEGSAQKVWMVDVIESFHLPVIGSDKKTLQNVLRKEVCQSILKKHGIPVPEFVSIPKIAYGQERAILEASAISYPAVVKLSAESGSMGMTDDSLVKNIEEAILQIRYMIETYQGDVIIESFLPSTDITVGYFQKPHSKPCLLTTYYKVEGKPGATSIMGHKERFMLWGGKKHMPVVEDEAIMEQVETIIPKACEVLNIRDTTRIDGRLDENGQLKIFDVNGFPALVFPESVQVMQGFICFPSYDQMMIYEALLHTIILSAATRYGINLPASVQSHNFFTLECHPSLAI